MKEPITFEAMKADHAAHVGRLIRVDGCQVGDGTGNGYGWKDFPDGLWVRVSRKFGEGDFNHHVRDRITDTYWYAEAEPGQLPGGQYVSWIDGPTYYDDGRRVTPSWLEVESPIIEAAEGIVEKWQEEGRTRDELVAEFGGVLLGTPDTVKVTVRETVYLSKGVEVPAGTNEEVEAAARAAAFADLPDYGKANWELDNSDGLEFEYDPVEDDEDAD